MASLPTQLSYGDRTRVVLIGTSKCPKDEKNLPPIPHAERNILELTKLFKEADLIGLSEVDVIPLLNLQHASEIVDSLGQAADQATHTLIVYYVGHGLRGDNKEPLYLAVGATESKTKHRNAIKIGEIRQAIANSPARRRVLILDCCYSGIAFTQGGLSAGEADQETAERVIDIEGTYGIAAAPGNEKALYKEDERFTIFTGALIATLEHGISNAQEVLTLDDVFTDVKKKINLRATAPIPQCINWQDGASFRFARNRYREQQTIEQLAASLQELKSIIDAHGRRLETIAIANSHSAHSTGGDSSNFIGGNTFGEDIVYPTLGEQNFTARLLRMTIFMATSAAWIAINFGWFYLLNVFRPDRLAVLILLGTSIFAFLAGLAGSVLLKREPATFWFKAIFSEYVSPRVFLFGSCAAIVLAVLRLVAAFDSGLLGSSSIDIAPLHFERFWSEVPSDEPLPSEPFPSEPRPSPEFPSLRRADP